jgi:hypothetical protein
MTSYILSMMGSIFTFSCEPRLEGGGGRDYKKKTWKRLKKRLRNKKLLLSKK